MSLRLELELLLKRHGWPVVVGLAVPCIMAAGLVASMMAVPAPQAVVLPAEGARLLEERQRAFHAVLIPRAQIEERQRVVLAAAQARQLVPGRVDYGYADETAGRFGLATLRLPLTGHYADLRAFLAAALAAEPALALREIAIQRAAAGLVSAQLELVFHTEPAGEPRS